MADDPVSKELPINTPAPRPPDPPTQLAATGAPNDKINIMSWGAAPVLEYGMNFTDIGNSGLRAFAGYVREEFLLQLQGRQGAQKYREMMDNSAIIGAIMFAIQSTMRKVEWRVEPANDSGAAAEMADFADSLRSDMSHTWEDLISENLSMLGYGYSPHEIVYKRRLGEEPGLGRNGKPLPASQYDDGRIGWRRIPIRGQDTVLKWFFDDNGGVQGMTQQPWVGPIVDLPIEKMLLFRPSAHKNNPEGRSILRNSYRAYYFIKRLEEQEAILFERLNGVPVVKVPASLLQSAMNGDAGAITSLNAFKNMARNVRIDEQMGIVIPSDTYDGTTGPSAVPQYSFELATPTAGRASVKADETIRRYQTDILTSCMSDFLTLGHNSSGTQALAVSKVDMFFQAIEGYLSSTASIYNRYALPRVWKLNGFNRDLMPQYQPDLASRVDLDVLSNFVLRMSQAGMPMFPDEDLQTMLRDSAGLPDATSPEAMAVLETEQAQADATLENTINPPEPAGGMSPLKKIILTSIARRIVKHGGNRFSIDTAKPRLKRYKQRPPLRA